MAKRNHLFTVRIGASYDTVTFHSTDGDKVIDRAAVRRGWGGGVSLKNITSFINAKRANAAARSARAA